jgi:hypothetical protein
VLRSPRAFTGGAASSASLPRLPSRFRPRWRLDPAGDHAVEAIGAKVETAVGEDGTTTTVRDPRGFDPHDVRSFAASADLGKDVCEIEQRQLRRHD